MRPVVKRSEALKRRFKGVALDSLAVGERAMVTKMNYAAGDAASLHSHPHEQCGYVISGRYRLRIAAAERGAIAERGAAAEPERVAAYGQRSAPERASELGPVAEPAGPERPIEVELTAGDSYAIPGGWRHAFEVIEAGEVIDLFTPPREDYL